MADTSHVQNGKINAEQHESDPAHAGLTTARRGALIAACLIAAAALAVTTCALTRQASSESVLGASEADPAPGASEAAATRCLSTGGGMVDVVGGYAGEPVARAISTERVPLHHLSLTPGVGNNTDKVVADQVILNFAAAPRMQGFQDYNIALVHITAAITEPTPWQAANSMMLVAYQPNSGHPDTLAPACPLADDGLLHAMSSLDLEPLPQQIIAGQTRNGWVPVAYPKRARSLTLHLTREQPNGSIGTAATILMRDSR